MDYHSRGSSLCHAFLLPHRLYNLVEGLLKEIQQVVRLEVQLAQTVEQGQWGSVPAGISMVH